MGWLGLLAVQGTFKLFLEAEKVSNSKGMLTVSVEVHICVFSAHLHFSSAGNSTLILLLGIVLPLVQWRGLIQLREACQSMCPPFTVGLMCTPNV